MSVRDIVQAAAGNQGNNAWDIAYATFQGIVRSVVTLTERLDIKFSPDGTRMYLTGATRESVLQYDLPIPYQPSPFFITGKSVNAEEGEPNGLEFKPDGTKMYIIGTSGDDINEYNLSIAWDVTTASYVQNFSVSAQTGAQPLKVRFKEDGTKMYVLSITNDAIYQYSLSTPWNISTASYDSVSFSVSSQDATPFGLFFGDSGTKMYITGTTTDTVYQYTLSTPWDLSTASYANLFISVAAQEATPTDVFFKSDGTIMYVIGTTGDDVNQYALTVPWNVSTASFTKVSSPSFGTWYGETSPAGFYIRPDGARLYVVGVSTDTVFQQSMATPWDVATLSAGFYVGVQALDAVGLAFKPDGTKMYVLNSGSASDAVFQYSLATAWDVFTASYDSVSFSVAGEETAPRGVTFKPDGTKMYIVGTTGDDVNEYDLGTAWNVSTATYVQNFSVATEAGALPYKVEFSDDGTKMFIASGTNDTIFQYSLSSAWDISTASYNSVSYNVVPDTGETVLLSFTFSDSGKKMYITGDTLDRMYGFILDTAWDLASIKTYYKYVGTQEGNPASVTFKPDGTEMYILGFSGDDVNQYSLSVPWQVQSASYVQAFSVAAQTGTVPTKVQFKDDGTKMYVLSRDNDSIYQYSLSTAWDISTATYDTVSFSVTAQEATPWGMFIGDAGSKLYVIGISADTVFQYTLSTPWDLSTASYASLSKSVTAQETSPFSVFIGNSGSTMYIVGATSDTVFQYTLSTPWDVSTATYDNKSFSLVAYFPQPTAVWFKDDGKSFYVTSSTPTGNNFSVLYQFTIS